MTLIARILCDNGPFYMGDIVISGPNRPEGTMMLPTVADANQFISNGSSWFNVGTRQKVNIYDGRLILAYAGSNIQASAMARDLRDALRSGASTAEDLVAVISAVPFSERDDLALLGSIISPAVQPRTYMGHFEYGCEKTQRGPYTVHVAGTGKEVFKGLFEHHLSDFTRFDAMYPNLYQRAIELGISIAASCIGHESATGANLQQWWGGALELAVLDQNLNFSKLDNILNTEWILERQNDTRFVLRWIPRIFQYAYADEYLDINVIDLQTGETNARIHRVLPLLHTPVTSHRIKVPEYEHARVLCHVWIEGGLNGSASFTHFHPGSDMVRFVEEDGKMGIEIESELFSSIAESARQAFGIEVESFSAPATATEVASKLGKS